LPIHPAGHLLTVPARARRDELIALVVLIALAAAITGILAVIEPSASPLSDDEPSPAASATVSPEDAPETPETTEAPEATGVRLWDEPFVYACSLLPSGDVARIFGASGPQGYQRQQYLDRTPTATELEGASAFAYGGLSTRCTHWFDDKAGHALDVVVTQFPSTGRADRRWRQLARAGRPVPASHGRLVYLPESRSFALSAGAVTVEARYTGARPIPRGRQAPLMREVVTAVDLHVADSSAVAGPVPTSEQVTGTVGGTPYVEPCALLDTAAFEALGGPPPEPVVVDTSVIRHDPYANAAVSSCERSGTRRDGGPRRVRSTFAVLEVRVAPDPLAAQQVLDRHLDNRYPKGTEIRDLEGYDGTAYVVDVEPTRADPLRTRIVHVVLGSYELRLAAVRDVGPKRKSGQRPTEAQLVASIEAMAEALEAASTPVP
jgi:hypothetical protein